MEDWREPTEAEAETILRKVKKRIKSNRINLGLLSVVIGFYCRFSMHTNVLEYKL